jgi:hypothetical protein
MMKKKKQAIVGSLFLSAGAAGRHEPGHAAIIAMVVIGVGNILLLFTGLIVSAVHGSRAARLRKRLAIPWPPG